MIYHKKSHESQLKLAFNAIFWQNWPYNALKRTSNPMLIEFSVTNYRSIREKQTLNMVASKGKELLDTHTFQAPIAQGKSSIRLLRSAAIYGANAAGKTNLMRAYRAVANMVMASEVASPIIPFMLDPKTRNSPSEFEIHFIIDQVRYQYGFTTTQERIMEEWLMAYPHERTQHWFARQWLPEEKKYQWQFGDFFRGEKNSWKKMTRDNTLFLSTAIQFNSQQLLPIHKWFTNNIFLFGAQRWGERSTISLYEKNKKEKKKVLEFLKKSDLGIDDLNIETKDVNIDDLPEDMPKNLKSAIRILNEGASVKEYNIESIHEDMEGKFQKFPFNYESSGTQRIFSLAAHWITALEQGRIIFIDEFSNHLHVNLTKLLVRLFHGTNSNPHNAQLIFITHETSILDQIFMRRDQIWFCEKNKNSATVVYPLMDFYPRKGKEYLELRYLSGSYGAIPYIQTPIES